MGICNQLNLRCDIKEEENMWFYYVWGLICKLKISFMYRVDIKFL